MADDAPVQNGDAQNAEEVDDGPHTYLFIKGGKVVNADFVFDGDVLVTDGVISAVGSDIQVPEDATVIDASGKLLIPGGIDPHVHLNTTKGGVLSADDYYSGTKAAIAGGTTTIIDYVFPSGDQSLVSAFEDIHKIIDDQTCCDFSLHMNIMEWNEKISEQMAELCKEKGVNSFNIRTNEGDLYPVFLRCRQIGAIPMFDIGHSVINDMAANDLFDDGVTGPEGHLLSHPEEIEASSALRAITVANQAICPIYIENVASKGTAEIISEARRDGCMVFVEGLVAATCLTGEKYFDDDWKEAAKFLMTPPLREDPETPEFMMNYISSGDIHTVASGHCSFKMSQKEVGRGDFRKIPGGALGIEERMSLIWEHGVQSGKLDPSQFVAVTSSNAAKIFNLYPKKGRIGIGSDADIVIFDPTESKTFSSENHHQSTDYSIYEGMECHGAIKTVLRHGVVAFDNGEVTAEKGSGCYLETNVNANTVYGKVCRRKEASHPFVIEREAYDGPVFDPDNIKGNDSQSAPAGVASKHAHLEGPNARYARGPNKSGVRNQMDSSFSFGGGLGQEPDEDIGTTAQKRQYTRVAAPPGGRSNLFF